MNKKINHSKIAPTAWLTAYLRSFSDIPFSNEIFSQLEKMQRFAGRGDVPAQMKKPGLAPQYEARYKLLNKLLAQNNSTQVLELASGLSARGLSQTLKNEKIQYAELDLPEVIKQKTKIFREIVPSFPKNLYLVSGNALSLADIKNAISNFDLQKPITIIHEGLMRYLNFAEKEILAKNIRKILERSGGFWITSDISLKKILQQEDSVTKNHTKNLSVLTNLNLEKNLFDSVDHAKDFFENLGFTIERHSFLEVTDELVSPKRLGISKEKVEKMNSSPVVFVMKINGKGKDG